MQYLHIKDNFHLESGKQIDHLTIGYTTHGRLNEQKDNVVWVCHALTGNANPLEWWDGLFGPGQLFDPERHFIVCANMLGSCYGSTSPEDFVASGQEFPLITTRDMANAHELLRKHLYIETIYLGIGGSMGGQQLLEWAILNPPAFQHLCVLATNAQHSPWGIAFNETQRMALLADPTFGTQEPEAGKKGLEAARAIAMLSYRTQFTYNQSQVEENSEKADGFKASSYQRYQGTKLWKRFSPLAYYELGRSMDTHNVGRGRASVSEALQKIQAKTLVIGIDSDLLFPVEEQALLAKNIPAGQLKIIHSIYGHDGFLTETAKISNLIVSFLMNEIMQHTTKPKIRQFSSLKPVANLPGSESF